MVDVMTQRLQREDLHLFKMGKSSYKVSLFALAFDLVLIHTFH